MRLLEEATALEELGQLALGCRHCQPAHTHLAQQRERDGARFADTRFDAHVGTAVHADAYYIARPQHHFGSTGSADRQQQGCSDHPVS